jgi:hypothetical protein
LTLKQVKKELRTRNAPRMDQVSTLSIQLKLNPNKMERDSHLHLQGS